MASFQFLISWTFYLLFLKIEHISSRNPLTSQWLNYEPLLSPTAAFIPMSTPLNIIGLPRRIEVVEHDVKPASTIATFHVELHAPALPPVRFRLRQMNGNQTLILTTGQHNNKLLTSASNAASDNAGEFLRNDVIGIEVPSESDKPQHDRPYGAELRLRRPLDCHTDGSQLHLLVVVRDSSNSFFASQPISIVCKSAASNVPKFFSFPANSLLQYPTANHYYRKPTDVSAVASSESRLLLENTCSSNALYGNVDFDDQLNILLPTNIIYMYITENNRVGESIGRVTAHADDDDEFTQQNNVHYAIIGSSWPNSVIIDPSNGILRANTVFDYEKTAIVKLLVEATKSVDEVNSLTTSGQRPLVGAFELARAAIKLQSAKAYSFQRIVVKIENVNDNPPRFALDPYDVAVDVAATAGNTAIPITIIMSDDPDDDAAAFNCEPLIDETIYDISRSATIQLPNSLIRQVEQHPFVINSTSGELLLAQSVTQFNQSHFTLQLYANQTNVALPSTSPSSSSSSDPPTVSPLLYTLNGFRYAPPSSSFSNATRHTFLSYSLNNTNSMLGAVTPVQVLLPVVSTATQLNIWVYDRVTQLLTLEIDLPVKLSALGAPAIIPPLVARLSAVLEGRLAIGRIGPHRIIHRNVVQRFRRQIVTNTRQNSSLQVPPFADDGATNYTVAEFENMTMVAKDKLIGKASRFNTTAEEDDLTAPVTHNRSRTDVEVILIVMDSISRSGQHLSRYRILPARQVRKRLQQVINTTEWRKIESEFPAFVQLGSFSADENSTADDENFNEVTNKNNSTLPVLSTTTTSTNWIEAIRTSTLTGTPLVLLIVIGVLLLITLCIVCGLCCVLCCAKWRSARRRRRRATSTLSEADSAVIAINGRSAAGLDEGGSFLDGIGFVKPVYVAYPAPAGHYYHHLGAPLGLKQQQLAVIHHSGGPLQQQPQYMQVARRFSIALPQQQLHQMQQQQQQHHSATTTIYAVQPPPQNTQFLPPDASSMMMQQHNRAPFLYGNNNNDGVETTFLTDNDGIEQQQLQQIQHIMLPHFEYGGGGQQLQHPDLIPAPILINAYPPDFYYSDPFSPMPALPPPVMVPSNTQYEEQSDTMTIGSSSSQGENSNSAVVANESLPRLNNGRSRQKINDTNSTERPHSFLRHTHDLLNNDPTIIRRRKHSSGTKTADADEQHIFTHMHNNNYSARRFSNEETLRTKTASDKEAIALRPRPPPPPPRSD